MKTQKNNYSVLAILAIIYVFVVYRFQTFPSYVVWATGVFGVSYIIWGILHHLRVNNLRPRIVLEYLLVALLGVAIVSTLLL